MSRYRETLHRWAALQLGEGVEIIAVDISHDDGYDPTFTDRPESTTVSIRYRRDGVEHYTDPGSEILTSVGELLSELFKIEEG